jgi:hypothetical protein
MFAAFFNTAYAFRPRERGENGGRPTSRGIKMHTRGWLALALLGVSINAYADEAELYLSTQSIQGRYVTGADLIGLGAGNLAGEVFTNEQDDVIGAVGLEFAGTPAGTSSVVLSAGPKVYGGTLDFVDDNFLAVAVGGKASAAVNAEQSMYLTGQFFYAPEIVSFGEAEKVMDLTLRLESEFVQNLTGFLGYRVFEVDLDNNTEYELDEDVHVGVRYSF